MHGLLDGLYTCPEARRITSWTHGERAWQRLDAELLQHHGLPTGLCDHVRGDPVVLFQAGSRDGLNMDLIVELHLLGQFGEDSRNAAPWTGLELRAFTCLTIVLVDNLWHLPWFTGCLRIKRPDRDVPTVGETVSDKQHRTYVTRFIGIATQKLRRRCLRGSAPAASSEKDEHENDQKSGPQTLRPIGHDMGHLTN